MSMEKEKILLKKEGRPEIHILYTCEKVLSCPFCKDIYLLISTFNIFTCKLRKNYT